MAADERPGDLRRLVRGSPPKDGTIPCRSQIQAVAEREEEQSQPQCGAAGGRSITREEDRKENRKRAWHHHREQRRLQEELHVLSSYAAGDPDRAVDSSESYESFLRRLAEASGIATPTRAELPRFDRKRPNQRRLEASAGPNTKITKIKDGGTRLSHKAEHAVDLETAAVVGVTV